MKIAEWLGFNEESSQYLLKRGELRALINLQPRRRGMLITRKGMVKYFGDYDEEAIFGMYRKDTPINDSAEFFILQKVVVQRTLTADQIQAGESSEEFAWMVRRLSGYPLQSRVIAQLPMSPNGASEVENMSIAEDRFGRLFLFFGHGASPLIYRPTSPTNVAVPMGLEAPSAMPSVEPTGEGYFLERVDVTSGGGSYWGPPAITLDGGSPDRTAKLRAVVNAGNIVGMDILDGGANYKTPPRIVISSDKIGSGFRAIGNRETDPGIQGFLDTSPGVVSGTSLTAAETFGANNSLDGNSIMYLSAPVTASTTSTPTATGATTSMVVASLTGVSVGDTVRVYAATLPTPFNSDTSVVRVVAITQSTNTVTLSKSWSPTANTTYQVQFRKPTSIGLAKASYDTAANRYSAPIPLRSLTGVGDGAESTLSISPISKGNKLGAFSLVGWTTPQNSPFSPAFAFRQIGWDNYEFGQGRYWNGDDRNIQNSVENLQYAGLQAGASFIYGTSGDVVTRTRRRTTYRRADVYFPNYSKISVWLNVGAFSDSINQWVRVDADVINGNTSQPYAIVELRPTVKAQQTIQTGRRSFRTVNTPYARQPKFRFPKVRINLKPCPDSWIQSDNNGDQNLMSSVKEGRANRLAWWHSSATTPRPLVDFRGAGDTGVDWGTIEVIDAGAGWEQGTVFSMRIHQANPYAQHHDFNTTVREQTLRIGHAPYTTGSRFTSFVFRATEPDNEAEDGPPHTIAGSQFVDAGGSGYRNGDVGAITLLKRAITADIQTPYLTFTGFISSTGQTTEFTWSGATQQPGARVSRQTGGSISASVAAGDVIKCKSPNALLDYSQVLSSNAGSQWVEVDKMAYPTAGIDSTFTGTTSTASNNVAAGTTVFTAVTSTSPLLAVGQKLIDTTGRLSSPVATITAISGTSGSLTVTVTGFAVSSGSATLRFGFDFEAYAGAKQAQTIRWTASTIAAGDGSQRITSIRILNGGRNYFSPPTLLVRGGGTGYGLQARAEVSGGKVTNVVITDTGRDYNVAPELYTSSSPATAVPIMRPTMRGRYRCAYRFVDRSETVVANTTISGVNGDSPTTVTLASMDGVKAGMLLESERLPHMTKILSVNGTQATLSQEASGVGLIGKIVVEFAGTGYAQNEAVTATIPGASGASVSVQLQASAVSGFEVREAVVTSPGTTKFPTGKLPVTFSAPAAGGAAASGYACITQFDPDTTYNKSVIVRDLTKPASYSDFSPIADIDAGPNAERESAASMAWSLPGVKPPDRADMVEFWRTSADQSLVFYRVEAYGKPSPDGVEIIGADNLSDEELFDLERPNYAAMPVVLPNGNVNAYRFGKPRTDMSVCVAFQDRLWYAVSTSGKDANTIFYSEFDEFESCPDVNDLPIQNNQRSTDSLSALAPFGSMLLAMQHAHTYAVTYNTEPNVDASIQMISHRGCLHQRCWDIHDNMLYAADENGIYSMSRNGEVTPLSNPIREYFVSELLNFQARHTFFLTVCGHTSVLRFFCSMASEPTDTPSQALCYDIERKTWWVERYPNSVCSAVTGRPGVSRVNAAVFGAVDGNMYALSGHGDYTHRTVVSCEVTEGGSGYKQAPKITCPNSNGVSLQGVVSEGRLVDVLVHSGGWGVWWGVKLATEDGRVLLGTTGAMIDTETPSKVDLKIEPPTEGGLQAKAVGVVSLTTRIVRDAASVQGSNVITLLKLTTQPIDRQDTSRILSEANVSLASESGLQIRTEGTPIEIGMEVFSDTLPLGARVQSILGGQITVAFEDGSPANALSTNTSGRVFFRKPYKTHIPFRLATGALQLANEDNVAKGGDTLIGRSVTLLYAPTKAEKRVELVEYFNESETPRPNVMRRDRGGPQGFSHKQDSASTVLNIEQQASALGSATGIAKATFAGRVYSDNVGADRHVRVELHGRPLPANSSKDLVPQEFAMHSLTIEGVVEDAE